MTRVFDPTSLQAQRNFAGPVLIYAPGSGWGHARRVLTLATAFPRAHILAHVDPGFPRPPHLTLEVLGPDPRAALLPHPGSTLIVDTFPAGLAGEVADDLLARFTRTILLARRVDRAAYAVVADYDDASARFDARWAPYPEDACEWEGEVDGLDAHLGWVVRAMPTPKAGQGIALLGAERAPTWAREALGDLMVPLSGALERLPPARAYLSWGAGYNTAYEWEVSLGEEVPWALMPLERRYDDQFGRALRLGRAVTGRAGLERWLSSVL